MPYATMLCDITHIEVVVAAMLALANTTSNSDTYCIDSVSSRLTVPFQKSEPDQMWNKTTSSHLLTLRNSLTAL